MGDGGCGGGGIICIAFFLKISSGKKSILSLTYVLKYIFKDSYEKTTKSSWEKLI
mgnify:CR=1 FL=1